MLFYTVEPQQQKETEPKTSWAELDAKVLDIENVVVCSVFVNCPVQRPQSKKQIVQKIIGKNKLLALDMVEVLTNYITLSPSLESTTWPVSIILSCFSICNNVRSQ